VCSSDLIC